MGDRAEFGNAIVARLRAFRIATDPAFPIHPTICDEAADEIERLQADNERFCRDWCDDDEDIKQRALRVLDAEIIEGDTWHVPRMGELAKMLADEVERLQILQKATSDHNKMLQSAIKRLQACDDSGTSKGGGGWVTDDNS